MPKKLLRHPFKIGFDRFWSKKSYAKFILL